MRGTLPALTGAAAVLARKGEDALESTVYVSPLDFLFLGRVKVNAAGDASWHPEQGVTIPTTHVDIHLRCDDGQINLSALPSVTLDVTIDDGSGGSTAGTALAAFAVPGWRDDQGKTFPIGAAVDFIPQGAGNSAKAVKSITGLDSSANLPNNSEWSVFASPAETTFIELGMKRGASGPYQTPGQIPIADGYEASAMVKRGRSDVPELNLSFVHIHSWAGLTLYNGRQVTALVKVVRDKSVHVGWDVYTGYRPDGSPSRGDGNEEVVAASSGPYQKHLLFTAM